MKHKRPSTLLRNRALALLMAVFVTVQLTIPVYAEPYTEPLQQEGTVTETQDEVSQEQPEEAVDPALPTAYEDKETTEPEAAPAAVQPTVDPNTLMIPGYTRVTTANLETNRQYLIVSQDSKGKLYAFYPDAANADLSAGSAIEAQASKGCFVAALTVANGQVSAIHESDKKALSMNDLHFTVTRHNAKYTFRGSNDLYLALQSKAQGDRFLTKAPMNFTVTATGNGAFTLYSDGTRILDFNRNGDKNQFTNNGKVFETNFWGPSKNPRYNIYLYTKNDVVVVNKEGLKSVIEQAQKVDITKLSQDSAAAIQAALQEAIRVRDDAAATSDAVQTAEYNLNQVILAQEPKKEFLAEGAPQPGTTKEQPFPQDVAGIGNFRIPSIITLKDGTMVSAIDARWNHHFDGFNIDTMLSVSKDNGHTWNYSFPNFFNDSVNHHNEKSTAFIDPVLAQGKDGTLYLMVDLMPGGNWTRTLQKLSGYETVDGQRRMVLYTMLDGHTHDNYSYYVGDFQNGYAPVIAKGDADKTPVYYVNDHYYLYTAEKKPMYCRQLDSDKYVQQNVFFTNAALHTADAVFLWLITSQDGGETWSAPTILNPQVRDEVSNYVFYGVGPGAGISMENGMVLLPCYDHAPESASFVYTQDQGKTWKRSPSATDSAKNDISSESALVKIDEKTVRQFYRDSLNDLRYTDFTWNADTQTWTAGQPVKQPGVVKATQTQFSAIRYSREINGKPVILVSTATATTNPRRTNGKVYAFNLESDHSMTHIGTYQVTGPGVTYAYSSLTELQDGSIGLIYESHEKNPAAVTYLNLSMDDILQIQRQDVELSCGEQKTFPVKASDVVVSSDPSVVNGSISTENKQISIVNGAQGHHGTDVKFDGKLDPLSTSLFQFVGSNDTGIQITAKAADGTQVWVSTETNHYPSATTATTATLTENANGTFLIHTDASYLYFWRDNSKGKLATFDRVGNAKNTPACEFKLYRPAAAGEQSDLPGYVPVTKLDEVQDGGFYLIVAAVGKELYVLHPTVDQENLYAQSLKVDLKAEKINSVVPYQQATLTLTAQTAGTAEVQVGTKVYQVTVSHKVNETVWHYDNDPTHGHWHTCDGCMDKIDQAPHNFVDEVIADSTTTQMGTTRHTCETCGFYYDEQNIPVKPENPTDPSEPVQPGTPEGNHDSSIPSQPNHTESKPANPNPSQSTAPATGDTSPVALWITAAGIGLCGVVTLIVSKKRKKIN